MIYLIIAREGGYSDKETWVAQAFTDEAAAVEEAARLNVVQRELETRKDAYYKSRQIQGLDVEIGTWLDHVNFVDDYTVVAVPVGERGRWNLP